MFRHPGRKDLTGLTLLFVSAEAGSDEVCRLLLDKYKAGVFLRPFYSGKI